MLTLEVAKQGAIYHGLATLLNQPSPMMPRGKETHQGRRGQGQMHGGEGRGGRGVGINMDGHVTNTHQSP